MRKPKERLFALTLFIIYQIFFYWMINVAAYYSGGVKLSMETNILFISLNILVLCLMVVFYYCLCNAPHSSDQIKKDNNFILTMLICALIGWIFLAMSSAMEDAENNNNLKTIYEYFASKFKIVIGGVLYLLYFLMKKLYKYTDSRND